MPSDAFVYDAVRTPRGRGKATGSLHGTKPITLVTGLIDAQRCLAEGVLRTEEDGNVGPILGIGYPAWTGGVLRFAKQHEDFRGRAAELAERYGDRFVPA